MKSGVDRATGMKAELQTDPIPFVVDIEIVVRVPRQSWHSASCFSIMSLTHCPVPPGGPRLEFRRAGCYSQESSLKYPIPPNVE